MPIVVILAGPNGAGKTTAAATLLRGPLRVDAFVNADIIAQGLGNQTDEQVDVLAGRIMLRRLHELADLGADFAFETTLASRSFARRVTEWKQRDYIFCLLYLWVPRADDSIERVKGRVASGGHFVPDETVRRRYKGGLRNFFHLYRPLADIWRFYDNSGAGGQRLIASGVRQVETVRDPELWQRIRREVDDDPEEHD